MAREIKKEDGWIIREILEANGRVSRHYIHKRKRAPRIELRSRLAKQLAGYALIEKDLRNVLAWLTKIEELAPRENYREKGAQISIDRENFNLVKGMFVASLTFYAKCYTSCEGRQVRLDRKFMDEQFRAAHEQAMRLRHNFAAHSGADRFEEVKIALVLPPRRKKGFSAPPWIYRELQQPDIADPLVEDVTFEALAGHIRDKVLDKINVVNKRILEEEVLPRGAEYWYQRGKGT